MGWTIERWQGSASEFHARAIPDDPEPSVWIFEVTAPALVLGSTQPDSIVDHQACRAAGVEVVRRRSGGGAVLLDPGDAVWVDLVVPTGHHLADPDVGRATWWVGDAWAATLERLGVTGEAYRGPMVRTSWSSLVCFAGLGPGEVTVGGAKTVGVSQRRVRQAARFQTAAVLGWRPERLVGLLSPPFPTDDTPSERFEQLRRAVRPVDRTPDQVLDALLEVLAPLR